MTTPDVSVVIPTFNAAEFLADAVESALAQTFKNIEIIVVDNDSKDHTPELMSRYGPPVRYLRQDNRGPAGSRNRGLAESRGRWVAFLDADDVWLPAKLERQLDALRLQPHGRACHTAFNIVDAGLAPLAVQRSDRQGNTLEELLLRGNVVGTPTTVVFERGLFAAVGGFDVALSYGADWDLWIRLATRTEFVYVDEPLACYRRHASNMSRDVALLEADSVRLLESAFARLELPDSLRRRRREALARNWTVLAGSYLRAAQPLDAVRCGLRAFASDPRLIGRLPVFLRALRRARQEHLRASRRPS